MAEERSGGRERKGRRRYFRPKKNTKENPNQPQAAAKPPEAKTPGPQPQGTPARTLPAEPRGRTKGHCQQRT